MRVFVDILRIVLSFVFFASGIIKAVDSFGFSLKLKEYFLWFGSPSLSSFSIEIAVLVCAIEIMVGFLLLIKVYRKAIAIVALLLIMFFALITFFIAINDNCFILDCGCFGEWIHLKPTQSLLKNMILLLLLILYNVGIRKFPSEDNMEIKKRSVVWLLALSFGIPMYSIIFLPPVDSLPYNVGANLHGNKDFRLFDDHFKNKTTQLLQSKDRICMITILTNTNISTKVFCKLNALSKEGAFELYIITTPNFDKNDFGLPHLYTDEKTLKSFVRSNEGIVTIYDGIIKGKWNLAVAPISFCAESSMKCDISRNG